MENLGNEIATFMWDYADWYELRDCYDSFEELVTETIASLYDRVKRNVMALVLKESIEWSDDEDEAVKAAELYRKVKAL